MTFRRTIRTRQPQGIVGINRGAVSGLELKSLLLGSNPDIDLARGIRTTFSEPSGRAMHAYAGMHGFGRRVSAGFSSIILTPDFTVPGNQAVLFGHLTPRLSANGIGFQYKNSSSNSTTIRVSGSGTEFSMLIWDATIFAITIPVDVPFGFAIRIQGGSHALYINGKLAFEGTANQNAGLAANQVVTDTTLMNMACSAAGLNVSDQTLARLSENPWQVFEQIETPIFAGRSDAIAKDGTSLLTKRRVVRRRQPQSPVRVDRSNPITQGLFGVYLPSAYPRHEVINGTPNTATLYSNEVTAGKDGIHYPFVRTNPSSLSFAVPPTPTGRNLSVLALASIEDDISEGDLFRCSQGFYGTAINVKYGAFGAQPTSNDGGAITGTPVELGKPCVVILTDETSARATLYVDGRQDGISTGYNRLTSAMVSVGSAYNGSPRAAKLYLGAAWMRKLSDAEVRSLTENPWQIFEPHSYPLFRPTAIVVSGPVFSRPITDVSAPGWVSTELTLAAAISEETRSDSSFITSPDIAYDPAPPARFLFDTPAQAGAHRLSFSAQHISTAGQLRVVFMSASGVPVGASEWITTTLDWQLASPTVTITGIAIGAQIEVRKIP